MFYACEPVKWASYSLVWTDIYFMYIDTIDIILWGGGLRGHMPPHFSSFEQYFNQFKLKAKLGNQQS